MFGNFVAALGVNLPRDDQAEEVRTPVVDPLIMMRTLALRSF
jgi:hypothetical protein